MAGYWGEESFFFEAVVTERFHMNHAMHILAALELVYCQTKQNKIKIESRGCVSEGFCCCDKEPRPNTTWGEKDLFYLTDCIHPSIW